MYFESAIMSGMPIPLFRLPVYLRFCLNTMSQHRNNCSSSSIYTICLLYFCFLENTVGRKLISCKHRTDSTIDLYHYVQSWCLEIFFFLPNFPALFLGITVMALPMIPLVFETYTLCLLILSCPKRSWSIWSKFVVK